MKRVHYLNKRRMLSSNITQNFDKRGLHTVKRINVFFDEEKDKYNINSSQPFLF